MKKALFILVVIALSGCGYKFNGASTEGLKTIRVEFFENNAPLVVPNMSQLFTEDLKERIRTQSKLSITQNEADATFEGRITGYDIKPIAIQDNARPIAGANRLTITVQVKYTNNTKTEGTLSKSFDESFTAFEDFSLAGQSLQSQEQALIKKVNAKLTDNIFNRAFAQW
ncbi:LptE family protein [Pedobacter boryungensis]|uniref:LptE family protein n=1 Tax=Pedobacter boryungensis TaxID=869962 RepID=A0ABX2DF29_9SPHI|nr:LptE family protein [Pedobacter boryungensis]NQX31896.1 LptE family protein [Pedobacter boryungensis]